MEITTTKETTEMTTYTIDHVTGYEPTTEDGPGAPIIERITVTRDDLLDNHGLSEDAVDALIRTGTLGEHDEWQVVQ